MPEKKKLSKYEKALALKHDVNEVKKMSLLQKTAALEKVLDDAVELLCDITFETS